VYQRNRTRAFWPALMASAIADRISPRLSAAWQAFDGLGTIGSLRILESFSNEYPISAILRAVFVPDLCPCMCNTDNRYVRGSRLESRKLGGKYS
jgi:hypothetical protein